MAHAAARVIIAPRLRLSSYLCLRLAVPFIAYLPLSMSYTLVSVAFGLPFNGRSVPPNRIVCAHVLNPPFRFSFASGFFIAFVFNYLGMLALGLSLEAMITLLTPKFIPYFLFILVRPPPLLLVLFVDASGADHLQRRSNAFATGIT